MEMTSCAAPARLVPRPEDNGDDDPEVAAAAPLPWRPPGSSRERKSVSIVRVLLVGSLATPLLLLACFVLLGRENALSTAPWLQALTSAKLDNGTAAAGLTTNHSPTDQEHVHGHGRDELLGGLLPAGMDRRSCRSRYNSWRYYKHFPYTASPYLKQKLRAYEARHRRCAPGTPPYAAAVEQLRSARSSSSDDIKIECRYVVWLPFDGLGNRMLSMASVFLYALLTDRVFLVALPPDSGDLFCEPFPDTTWRLPTEEFPIADLVVPREQDIDRSYTKLLDAGEVGPTANSTVPAYLYLSLGWLLRDGVFFCGEHQVVLGKVDWLMFYSDLYFAPSLYAVSGEFRDELRRMFPEKESVGHLLSRYLFHPTNHVWSLVTRYYRSYLALASRRVGVQIRMFDYGTIPADDMFGQILACSKQENILPEIDDDVNDNDGGDHDEAVVTTFSGDDNNGDNNSSNSTAILVASLYTDYYERLRSRYYEHAAAKGGETVAVFQPSHEEHQASHDTGHNRRALAEIYLLSFSDELLTSGRSTFGYISSSLAGIRPTILLTAYGNKVPEPPCRRAVSMEPCNLTPPLGVECQQKPVDKDDLVRHLRVCEDSKDSVKLFD